MDREVSRALSRLISEMKKDLRFFGFCGLIVGLFLGWQGKASERGWSEATWASDLLADFMAFNVFALVFFAYLALGCIATISIQFGFKATAITSGLDHVEERLTQVASSILAFMAGLLAFVALISLLNLDSGGLKALAFSALCCFLIGATYIGGNLVARRAEPFDQWWVALMMLVSCLGVLGWLLFKAS